MQIGKKEIVWNYIATFLKIASGSLLLPFILHMWPTEEVGIWTVFITITSFAGLLDFGFNPSFTRNVTYVFSGVRSLKTKGHESIDQMNIMTDYGLLKGVIHAMRWFYIRMSLVVLILLSTLGTLYIHLLLATYRGDHVEVYFAWGILCLINTYNLYTLYYDSLLEGKGMIKRAKQIIIVGQSVYLIFASVLILKGFGLIAIVFAQASSTIILRVLSYYSFYTPSMKQALQDAIPHAQKKIFQAIYPNALKMGLTSLGGFMVNRSAIIIGSFYLTLSQIASYGITMQIIGVISTLGSIYTITYQPKIVQLRVVHNSHLIKTIYLKGELILMLTFIVGGGGLLFLGHWVIDLIGSKTILMPFMVTAIALIVSFLEMNHSIAGSILLTKNEVPFFKASLLSGGFVIVLLFLFFNFSNIGLWAMIVAPGIAQGVYQNWKWPLEVAKELGLRYKEIWNIFIP